ncbi:MAG: sigma-70 family RNA polymerase sigma factor [Planctomycetota bacterium]
MRSACAGDPQSLDEIERRLRCVPRILTALNGRRGRPLAHHDLADVIQDTLVLILRKLPDYEPRAPLEGWLYRVCCLEFANALRRSGKRRPGAPLEDPDAVATVDVERLDEVHLALGELGGLEEDVIRGKHFEGWTFVEMASHFGESENTVKTRYYRAMKKLERLLLRYRVGEERA